MMQVYSCILALFFFFRFLVLPFLPDLSPLCLVPCHAPALPDYPQNPTFNHLTQVVWKNTTELGCGVALCNGFFDPKFGPATFHVCFYNPVGNVIGQEQYVASLSLWCLPINGVIVVN